MADNPQKPKERIPEYNAEEREILRLAKFAKDMIETDWWKSYRKIIETQIATREAILLTPLTDIAPKQLQMLGDSGLPVSMEAPWDFETRVMKSELLKGAVIGLKLALSIPQATIDHSAAILAEHSEKTDG